MNNQEAHFLRELTRLLVRRLGILEKVEGGCCGITVAQCHAIVELGRSQHITLNELAELLALDKSTMSRTINNLVDRGLVERELNPEDRRYVSIKLTEEGLAVFQQIEASMEEYYQRVFVSIPTEKRDVVLESLKLLITTVEQNKCCEKEGGKELWKME